jgi:DNA-binding Lrp family transcriptional regulator
MTKGISSYEDLAKECNVARSTIYRRVMNLEATKIITSQLRVSLDFEKLDLVALHFGINVDSKDEEKTIDTLKKQPNIKMIWRTYGAYNLIAIVICDKGCEGKTIDRIREVLEQLNVKTYEICVGFRWEKVDMTPF